MVLGTSLWGALAVLVLAVLLALQRSRKNEWAKRGQNPEISSWNASNVIELAKGDGDVAPPAGNDNPLGQRPQRSAPPSFGIVVLSSASNGLGRVACSVPLTLAAACFTVPTVACTCVN